MPLVRFTTSVAGPDYAFGPGDGEVRLDAELARQFVAAGWAELVRAQVPETPEGRASRPEVPEGPSRERRVQRRGHRPNGG